MSIERRFDVSLIAEMALREKQIQQSYRPIIGVHKWFARRPGTLFRGLLLAEFGQGRLEDLYFRSNDFPGLRIADPFMGGGTPLIEANRVGCDVEGFDINPMSAWIVREEIEPLDIAAYERAARALMDALRAEIDQYYRTSCPRYGDADVPVKSFLWVKVLDCEACGATFDLFPGYLLAENRRHPANVLVCPACGDLNEVDSRKSPGDCASCAGALHRTGPAHRGRCECPHCGHSNAYPGDARRPLGHRLFAIEYYNPYRKAQHKGRFFKKPDAEDLARVADAAQRWAKLTPRFVPEQYIPPGDETDRLHRWGYAHYRELFNPRQLLGLELSCRLIAEAEDSRIRRALATNLSDLLRYQNMLCRYDTMALKALDIFSVHGFPVGLVQCESNLTGIVNGAGANVGSGGWSNIVDKYVRAKRYCEAPYEVRRIGSRNVRVPIVGERIGERRDGGQCRAAIRCMSATESELVPGSLDAPPRWADRSTSTVRSRRSSTPCSFAEVPDLRPNAGCSTPPRNWSTSLGRTWRFSAGTGRKPTHGDTRCIILGHLTRMAIWTLREGWDSAGETVQKIAAFRCRMTRHGDPDELARRAPAAEPLADLPLFSRQTGGAHAPCGAPLTVGTWTGIEPDRTAPRGAASRRRERGGVCT